MYLKVTDENEIKVLAPKGITEKEIISFVEPNLPKLLKYLENKNKKIFLNLKEDWVFLFGKKYSIKYITGFEEESCKLSGDYLWLLTKNGSEANNRKALNKYFLTTLIDKLKKIQTKWESIMDIPSHTISVTNKTTSWASNSIRTRNISFNLKLIHYKEEILNYIVVHELAHYRVHDHSRSFWKFVSMYFPNYKEVREKL